MIQLKIKKLTTTAILPTRAHDTDAGIDLYADSINWTTQYVEYGTGIAIEIPTGYFGLITPRSSITKYDMMLKNSVGIIDSDYRGEIKFRFHDLIPYSTNHYGISEKIGQLLILPVPSVEMIVVDELSDTIRGTGGFGSTGK